MNKKEIKKRKLAETLANLIIFDMFVVLLDFLMGVML